jgi:thioredoxin-related protein
MVKLSTLLSMLLIVLSQQLCFAQTAAVAIYDPKADAVADIKAAVTKAAAENKHVLIQVGGNWCTWCIKLHNLFHSNTKIDSILKADYIIVHLNYSSENKNLPILKELDFPQRFGFPVLVILDKSGKRIHTQETGLLESGEGYSINKIIWFLENWSVAALDPKKYQ